jgi:hypothetical protein
MAHPSSRLDQSFDGLSAQRTDYIYGAAGVEDWIVIGSDIYSDWSLSNCKEVFRNILLLVAASIVFARVILFVELWKQQCSSQIM